MDTERRIETPTDARQGAKGKPVLYVLLASLGLLAVAMVALLGWNGAKSPNDYASRSQDASRQEITGSPSGNANGTASSNSAGVPAGNPAYPAPAEPRSTGSTTPR
ncbi:hypothetical protein OPKNFCMD_2307 [Methylobacterium crusticola]|uniref:Uncharacterized protein n=1 Tax=Methylobacterium crusticola TaxID=1697972 RepID=A0ABQ4QW35_9HYPH|nr:hypothetical protein [Methylobacterium crusticola]GJD49575.1 hypothetical protein OPKNFCMD_2307 [Methylobacterium crusticola]